jgi:hypothetical protein
MIHWYEISPEDAKGIDLTKRTDIRAPKNENGEICPWPWEPQQLVGYPMGQYHCGYCGTMCVAGVPHVDYSDFDTKIDSVFLGQPEHRAEDGGS